MRCSSIIKLVAMLALLAVFAGASYAATRPRPEEAVGVPSVHSASDVVLECPPRNTISKGRYLAVYNPVAMTRARINV
jgi:hypothetical protein